MTVYTKQDWTSHEIIHTADLNHIEAGIESAHTEIANIETELAVNAYVNRTYTASAVALTAGGTEIFFEDINTSAGSLVTATITNAGISTNLEIYVYGSIDDSVYTTDAIVAAEILAANQTIEMFIPTPQDKIKIVIINNDIVNNTTIDLVVRTLGNYSFMDTHVYDPDGDGVVEDSLRSDIALKIDDGVSGKTYTNILDDIDAKVLTHRNVVDAHHTNIYDPTPLEKLALAGTDGIPSTDNKYVTNSDPRLSDARQPVQHAHTVFDVTDISTLYEPIIADKGTAFNKSFGTASDTICEGDDERLTNERTPTAHAINHKTSGTDAIKLDELAAPDDNTNLNASASAHGLLPKLPASTTVFLCGDGTWAIPSSTGAVTFGTTAGTVCEGNDARLSNARTPTVHAVNHKTGGSDAIKLDELDAPTDVATLNASTTTHGLLKKLDGDITHFLNGNGEWVVPQSVVNFGTTAGTACEGNDARLSDQRAPTAHAASHKSIGADALRIDELAAPTNNTNLNVSTTAHGLCPKLNGNTTHFLRGDGGWADPAGLSTTFVRWNEGELNTSTSFMPYYVTSDKVLTSVRGYIMVKPTGSNILVDIRKNNPTTSTASIFISDAAQAIQTTMSVSNGVYKFNLTSAIDATQVNLVNGDMLYIVFTQVGSTYPGSGIYFQVDF